MIFENHIFLFLIVIIAGIVSVLGVYLLRNQSISRNDQSKRRIRLIVVDSDANARDTLVKFLRFDKTLDIVGVASTGKMAIEKANQLNPTVILLDISLADMTALAVAETITQQMPGMRFVFVREKLDLLPENWSPGLPEPLVKPFDYRELKKAIQMAERYR